MEGKGTKILIAILIILILGAGAVLAYKIVQDKKNVQEVSNNENSSNILQATVVEKEVQIYKGNDRPIAVMIDNHNGAWPQAGLNDAYMVYEIIVEGGETRLMALFKGADLDKIGPVRSARHYFLDYAMENDAIYVHFGESPQAKSDITKYSIQDIDGIAEDGTTFWRIKDKYAPHNAVTSTENIRKIADRKGYRVTTDKEPVLNYVVAEVNLEEGKVANSVTIPYSYANTVEYEYDEDLKEYVRYSRGKKQVDWDTGKTVTTKNIIIEKVENWTLNDGTNKGRQTIDNIKEVDGYYITNGKSIPITCTKTSRSSQTIYKDLEGNEIDVNDGKTFIQICPEDADVEITE